MLEHQLGKKSCSAQFCIGWDPTPMLWSMQKSNKLVLLEHKVAVFSNIKNCYRMAYHSLTSLLSIHKPLRYCIRSKDFISTSQAESQLRHLFSQKMFWVSALCDRRVMAFLKGTGGEMFKHLKKQISKGTFAVRAKPGILPLSKLLEHNPVWKPLSTNPYSF